VLWPVRWERVGHPTKQYSKDDVSFLNTPHHLFHWDWPHCSWMEDYCREKINKVTTENLLTVSTPYKINRGMERWYCCRWLLLDILAVSSFCLGPGQILLWFDALRISIGLCVSAGVLKVIGAQPRRVMCNHTRCRSRERWTAGNYAKCRPLGSS
jgi:hypothetical protein